jgi:hypothetical protein
MWFIAHLFEAPSRVPMLVLAQHRLRGRYHVVTASIRAWRQRARDREALRRYMRYELHNAPQRSPDGGLDGELQAVLGTLNPYPRAPHDHDVAMRFLRV